MESEFMTSQQVCDYLNISKSILKRMVDNEYLRPLRLGRKVKRFRKSDVDKAVEILIERGY